MDISELLLQQLNKANYREEAMEAALLNIFTNVLHDNTMNLIKREGILTNIQMAIGDEKYEDWLETYN